MAIGIDPKFIQSTVYLYPTPADAHDGVSVGGSGFILGIMAPDNSLIYLYVVTNKHVVDGGCRVVRTNTPQGDLRIVEVPPEKWHFALDDDLAIAEFEPPVAGCIVMDEQFLGEDCLIDGWSIFPGDEVFLYGRLVTQDGQQKNKPVVRFGNISMLPDSEAPIRVGDVQQPAFLVECRSLSGFSGSPAFVHLTQPRLTEQKGWIPGGVRFLGVDCAHLPFWSQARQAASGSAAKIPDNFVETNSGIAVIVPAWRLKAFVNQEHLVRERAMALEKARGIERFTGSSLPSTYLAECIALVAEGDAVDPDAAAEHLPDCASIVVKILNGHAVGVGAIKGRRPQYAKLVATRSGHSFDDQMRELGYVAVGQNHQRQGISKEIVKALLDTAGQQPLFATTSSEHMARTLSSHGFALRGDKWPSKKGEDLRLWIRDV